MKQPQVIDAEIIEERPQLPRRRSEAETAIDDAAATAKRVVRDGEGAVSAVGRFFRTIAELSRDRGQLPPR